MLAKMINYEIFLFLVCKLLGKIMTLISKGLKKNHLTFRLFSVMVLENSEISSSVRNKRYEYI